MNRKTVLFSTALLATSVALASHHESNAGGDKKGHHRGKMAAMIMKKMDTDGDQKISQEEFAVFHNERFSRMDADSDGFVTTEEARTHHEKMREKWRQKRHEAESD
jgi:Ca2+-binding EF-hand superfamily protein